MLVSPNSVLEPGHGVSSLVTNQPPQVTVRMPPPHAPVASSSGRSLHHLYNPNNNSNSKNESLGTKTMNKAAVAATLSRVALAHGDTAMNTAAAGVTNNTNSSGKSSKSSKSSSKSSNNQSNNSNNSNNSNININNNITTINTTSKSGKVNSSIPPSTDLRRRGCASRLPKAPPAGLAMAAALLDDEGYQSPSREVPACDVSVCESDNNQFSSLSVDCASEAHVRIGSCRDSLASSSVDSLMSEDSSTTNSSIPTWTPPHRSIDITDLRDPQLHRERDLGQRAGPFSTVMTVISICPACDTIAILVLLMQLGDMLLSLVYLLFTYLTFVPSSASASWNGMSNALQEGAVAMSFLSVIAMDGLVMLVWLFLWGFAQKLVLDLAKMIIALSLGGMSSASGRGWTRVVPCLLIIGYTNYADKEDASSRLGLKDMLPLLLPQDSALVAFGRRVASWLGLHVWRRAGDHLLRVLALHVFSQGILRYVRDWLLQTQTREQQPVDSASNKTSSADVYLHSSADTTSLSSEAGTTFSSGPSSNGQVAATLCLRQKRKQSVQVRLLQPLWTAIASTKIVVQQEMELARQRQDEPWEQPDENKGLGDASFHMREGQVWLTHLDAEEVYFSTSGFLSGVAPVVPIVDKLHPDSSSLIDLEKPFYIRVNDAIWPSVHMVPVDDEKQHEQLGQTAKEVQTQTQSVGQNPRCGQSPRGGQQQRGDAQQQHQSDPQSEDHVQLADPMSAPETMKESIRWRGRIDGLSAGSSFVCDFISTRTGKVIYSTSFRTLPASNKAATESCASPTPPAHPQRPESPVTTLKNSIVHLEAKLAEEKNRLKTIRRDNMAKAKTYKKDIEKLAASLESVGNNDAKFRAKVQSNANLKQQHEEQASEYEQQLHTIVQENKRLAQQKAKLKAQFDEERNAYKLSEEQFQALKSELDGALRILESEKNSLQNKSNKLAGRLAKLESELFQQEQRNAEGLREAERRQNEQQSWEAELLRVDLMMQDRIRAQQAKNEALEKQLASVTAAARQQQATASQSHSIKEEATPPHQHGRKLTNGERAMLAAEQPATPVGDDSEQGAGALGTRLNPAAPQYNPPPTGPPPLSVSTTPTWAGTAACASAARGSSPTSGPTSSSSPSLPWPGSAAAIARTQQLQQPQPFAGFMSLPGPAGSPSSGGKGRPSSMPAQEEAVLTANESPSSHMQTRGPPPGF